MYYRRWHCHRFREAETLSVEVLMITSLKWEQKTARSLRSLALPLEAEGDAAQMKRLFWLQVITRHSAPPPCSADICEERKLWQEEARRGRLLLTVWNSSKHGTCPAQPPHSSCSSESSATLATVPPPQERTVSPLLSHAPAAHLSAWGDFCPKWVTLPFLSFLNKSDCVLIGCRIKTPSLNR